MKIKSILRSSKTDDLKPYFNGWLDARFGDHFAQVSIDSTLRIKMAIKDVSRARRQYVPPDIEEWCKRLQMPPQGVDDHKFVFGYKTDEGWVEGSITSDLALQAYINRYPQDWEIVQKCLGLSRQKSRHASAFIIADKPISDFIPLTSVGGYTVTSFTAKACEAVGGLKMDFLVVKAIKDIQDAIHLIQERKKHFCVAQHIDGKLVPGHRLVHGRDRLYDIWDLPQDHEVYTDIVKGNTSTVFQLDTPGAVQWLEYFNYDRPDGRKAICDIAGLAAFTALDRPGTLDAMVQHPENLTQHNMLVEYSRRARGLVGSQDIIPELEVLLPETYGVIVYQEQLQKVYQNLTGCTGSEAEEFRTNVAKKYKEKVDAAYSFFIERASKKLGQEIAQKVWDSLKTFGQYAFNLSHAASYAVTGYACAWLKHWYPLEWWCAVLRNATNDEINEKFWRHCHNFIELPDIKLSSDNWEIEGDKLRAPISLLHGIGEKTHEQLCKYAPYTSIQDLAEKIIAHRASGVGPKERKVKGETVTATAIGSSAIRQDTIHTLIVAGAADSLFDKDLSIEGKMDAYYEALEGAALKKSIEALDENEKAGWKRLYKTKRKKYPVLDAIGRYQVKKSALPSYGINLKTIITELPDYIRIYDNKRWRYVWDHWSRSERCMVQTEEPIINAASLEPLIDAKTIPDGGYRCAIIAYIDSVESFRYGDYKEKSASKLTFDVEGGRYTFIHWPDKDGSVPQHVTELSKGAIVVAMLERYKSGTEFAIRELRIIRNALSKAKDDDTT